MKKYLFLIFLFYAFCVCAGIGQNEIYVPDESKVETSVFMDKLYFSIVFVTFLVAVMTVVKYCSKLALKRAFIWSKFYGSLFFASSLIVLFIYKVANYLFVSGYYLLAIMWVVVFIGLLVNHFSKRGWYVANH